MSCYGCTSKFGIFNKENGCPQCGFSYCNKCLKYKAVLPKLNNKEHMVCKSCQLALTATQAKNTQEHAAPSLQRLASLESPPRAPITIYRHDQRIQQLKSGLTQTDREIAERLEKLREDRKRGPLPSEEEIADRLAMLKGQNPLLENKQKKAYTPSVFRSEQEQIDTLLTQMEEEQQLDMGQTTPVEDITARLAKLQGHTVPMQGTTDVDLESVHSEQNQVNTSTMFDQECSKQLDVSAKSCLKDVKSMFKRKKTKKEDPTMAGSDSDDDICEQEVIEKILGEAALEEKLGASDDSEEADINTEVLPWCIICNENATRKCLDCDNDLYCDSCFNEGHTNFDMNDHKSVAYQPPTKK